MLLSLLMVGINWLIVTGEVSGNKMRAADIEDNGTVWKEVLSKTDFANYIKSKYTLVGGSLIQQDEVEDDE